MYVCVSVWSVCERMRDHVSVCLVSLEVSMCVWVGVYVVSVCAVCLIAVLCVCMLCMCVSVCLVNC